MAGNGTIELSYFPGCSLATSARESNLSLEKICQKLGLNLTELDDWNCCGSSSAHSLDSELGVSLPARILALASSSGLPLLVMCPSCLLHLLSARKKMRSDPHLHKAQENRWGMRIDPELQIFHFFEILDRVVASRLKNMTAANLAGLKFAPYYGCMLARPPALRHHLNYHGLLERTLTAFGAEPIRWSFASRCCGTFLAAARPDVTTPMVNRIIQGARKAGAECIITACAMCQLNLEIRCTLKAEIPTLHFSEVLAIALGEKKCKGWFKRHLVNPRPLLRRKKIID